MRTHRAIAALLSTVCWTAAMAQDDAVTLGLSVSPSSFDPQLGALGSDETYYSHVYDALFMRDPNLQPIPRLATGYRLIDDLTWEIDLREGVTFHDGSAFDAQDVVFTLDRLPTVEGSDGLNTEKMAPITEVEVVDPHTIRLHTAEPYPTLVTELYTIFILSDGIGMDATTADFNSGEAAIGTGPYEFVEWRQGEEVRLSRNADYFEGPPPFESVTIREMPNAGSRVAALLAGDVDMIDDVPPLDVERLRSDPSVEVVTGPSARTIFVQFGMDPAPHPQVTAQGGGAPLDPNPLSIREVREALRLAVDRDLIVERIQDGLGEVVDQAVPAGFVGHSEAIEAEAPDPGRAQALLAEAGYPEGFALTLSCPNDRYVNDEQVCQALGQMFSRIGVETTVDTMPKSAYFGPMREGAFAAWMLGWGNSQGDAGSVLPSVMHSAGSWNGGTAIPAVDEQIDASISLMDAPARAAGLAEALETLDREAAYVPLYAQAVVAALREGLTYQVMADETTLAVNLRRAE